MTPPTTDPSATLPPSGSSPPAPASRRPPLWLRVSVPAGLLAQLAATGLGALLLAIASGTFGAARALREASLLVGFGLVYLDTHAMGHYLVGRAVGIRFRGFGVRGTDHPENYPPLLRQAMSALPMWVALTEASSRRAAGRRARAVMYAAGETSTTVCSLAAAAATTLAGAPWAGTLLVAAVAWNAAASIVVSLVDKGDYAKALRALRRG